MSHRRRVVVALVEEDQQTLEQFLQLAPAARAACRNIIAVSFAIQAAPKSPATDAAPFAPVRAEPDSVLK